MSALHRELAILAEPNFRRFFIGSTASLLGDGMLTVALSFAVIDITGSVTDLGYVLAASSVPRLLILLIGGVIADRFPRRRMLVIADVTRWISQGVAAALLISGQAHIWELMLLMAVHGSATAIFNPAATGLLPAITSDARLQQANAMRGLSISAGTIIGPALAGVIVAATDPGWAIAVDSATFAVSAVQMMRLKVPAHERQPSRSFTRDLREGWAQFIGHDWLRAYISSASLNNMLFSVFIVLGPSTSIEHYHGAIGWASLLTSYGIGALVGGIAALHIRPLRPLRTGALCLLLFAMPTLALAAHAPIVILVILCLLAGAGTTVSNALEQTAIQTHFDGTILSRISSIEMLGSDAAQPIGQAVTGPLAASLGAYPVLWAAGCAQLANALVTLAIPAVRNLTAQPDSSPTFTDEGPASVILNE